jgi:hypothetical protein
MEVPLLSRNAAMPTTTSADSPYVYDPLDSSKSEIRVLIVRAGTNDQSIETTLQRISLDQPRSYETISYVWGDARKRNSITVDGKTLDVPASAERAIRRMRTDEDRTIWIDAVCINQQDLREREQQVALMGDVYRKTVRNLVWLGPSLDSTAAAIEAMDAMWNDIIEATDDLHNFQEILPKLNFDGTRIPTKIALMMSRR